MDFFWLLYEQIVWCELETKVLFFFTYSILLSLCIIMIFFGNWDNLLSLNLLFFPHLNQIIVQSRHLFSLWCIFFIYFFDESWWDCHGLYFLFQLPWQHKCFTPDPIVAYLACIQSTASWFCVCRAPMAFVNSSAVTRLVPSGRW